MGSEQPVWRCYGQNEGGSVPATGMAPVQVFPRAPMAMKTSQDPVG